MLNRPFKLTLSVIVLALAGIGNAGEIPSLSSEEATAISGAQSSMKSGKLGSGIADLNSVTAVSRAIQEGRVALPLGGALAKSLPFSSDGTVAVDFVAAGDVNDLRAELLAIGADNISIAGHMVSARVSADELQRATKLGSVQSARFASARLNAGLVTSQGSDALRAPQARQAFKVDGSGVRVGSLSDSYNCRFNPATTAEDDQANGDLPADVIVLKDLAPCPAGSDEGRAMMQHIHDVAPGASQAFHTAFDGEADFANGIVRLRTVAGSDVIVDDVSYFAEPFFQDGVIAQAVDAVVADGAAYYSSAGNASRDSYEDGFRIAGFLPGLGILHDFDSGPGVDFAQSFVVAPGDFVIYSYQWDEPYFKVTGSAPASAQYDIDILALNLPGLGPILGLDEAIPFCTAIDPATGAFLPDVCQLPGFSNNIIAAGGSGDPIEVWAIQNNSPDPVTAEIGISIFAGPTYSDPSLVPGLQKYIFFQDFGSFPVEFDTLSSTSFGHSNAAGASAVGASFWAFSNQTPLGREFGCRPRCLNGFSSAGGLPILFDLAGNRLAEAEIRQTPDIVGPDGGNTTFFGGDITFFPGLIPGEPDGFPNFFGTSASAPHVAAVAALLYESARDKDVNPTPDVINWLIESTARDFKDFGKGYDFDTGFGFVNAQKALGRAEGVFNGRRR